MITLTATGLFLCSIYSDTFLFQFQEELYLHCWINLVSSADPCTMKNFSLVYVVLLILEILPSFCVILTWKTKGTNHFKIPWSAISMSKRYPKFPRETYNKSFTRQFTLDERCALGMPMSIAWHRYDPYCGMNPLRRPFGLGVSGIIPAILKDMIQYCCPAGSPVEFGMFLANVREAENQNISGCYDFTFPLGARQARQKEFGDREFVPLVRAPRVVLLVHDDHKGTDKTDKLVTTIVDAWPMFLFIMLSASVSGFAVWFLVSKCSQSTGFNPLHIDEGVVVVDDNNNDGEDHVMMIMMVMMMMVRMT